MEQGFSLLSKIDSPRLSLAADGDAPPPQRQRSGRATGLSRVASPPAACSPSSGLVLLRFSNSAPFFPRPSAPGRRRRLGPAHLLCSSGSSADLSRAASPCAAQEGGSEVPPTKCPDEVTARDLGGPSGPLEGFTLVPDTSFFDFCGRKMIAPIFRGTKRSPQVPKSRSVAFGLKPRGRDPGGLFKPPARTTQAGVGTITPHGFLFHVGDARLVKPW